MTFAMNLYILHRMGQICFADMPLWRLSLVHSLSGDTFVSFSARGDQRLCIPEII
jgi:hypothetical protein